MKLVYVLILALCLNGWSATTIEREFTCPLDQHRWTQRMEASGRAEALRLDSREVGRDVVQPPTLPQCPHCRFVIFDAKFDEDTVRRLKAFVSSADYKNFAAKSTPHACMATVQELLGAPPFHIGYSYLRASWAVEGNDAQCRRLLTLAREHFVRALDQMKPGGKDYINLALMCSEVERRIERWNEASARLAALLPVITAAEPKYELIVTQQLALITRQDSRPHIVGAHPDAPPPPVSPAPVGPKIALRTEPAGPEKPKSPPASKVPDLARPFIGGPGDEPLGVRPLVVRLPEVANGLVAEPGDPAGADAPPTIEVQPISEGLPDAEPLPEPVPLDKVKPRTGTKPKPVPANDKKNLKPKGKAVP